MRIGYARVSTKGQSLVRQIDALEREGCDLIFQEKASGKSTVNRPELAKALAKLNRNDVFVVAEWDRATRSMLDGFDIIGKVHGKGALLKVLDRTALDLGTPSGRAMLGLLSAFCQEERERSARRCREGIHFAKKAGVKFGRKPKLKGEALKTALEMLQAKKTQREIAEALHVSPATINKIAKAERAAA